MMKKCAMICVAACFLMFQTASATEFSGIDMVLLCPSGGAQYDTYDIGSDVQSYTARRYVSAFYMNKYETPYKLWHDVLVWAQKMGYVFANSGQAGSQGRRGAAPSEPDFWQPVAMIDWHDAIVWCNALSELYGCTPCYTYKGRLLKDSTDAASCDLAACDWSADGYRLPTETEWEYAARRTSSGFQRGDLASGQVKRGSAGDVAWYDANSSETHIVGTAGTSNIASGDDAQQTAGSGKANAMGIYDMSGNVIEFCWDWMANYTDTKKQEFYAGPSFGLRRVCRGGSWSPYTGFICAGDRYSYDPNEQYAYMGFRLCSTSWCSHKQQSVQEHFNAATPRPLLR